MNERIKNPVTPSGKLRKNSLVHNELLFGACRVLSALGKLPGEHPRRLIIVSRSTEVNYPGICQSFDLKWSVKIQFAITWIAYEAILFQRG